ncbi:DHA2 family efflux MFS transporter permease subunit [Planobispora takensis]|uniref:MFS transporter n=1 Tax=Planobispora takensis TaxID=1367882 RepID=A0A8J3SWA7_9ACTN|nr:DHA2 family efflux MFS transporter permease subunit [Planobispora takensis]GII01829.1 MFS transporter [Planobispora takensis]
MDKRGGVLPTLLITGVSAFMASMDNLVVTTALPTIRQDLHASLESLEWTVNAYTLTYAIFLLTAAILGDRFGRRMIFTSGVALFTAASAAAAMAPAAGVLIAARAVQGIGAAMIFPLSLTLLVRAAAPERRGAVIAAFTGMSGLAIALGPWVGGVIVEIGDWHWVFWINVPIGLVLVPLAARLLSESHGPYGRLDVRGTLLVTSGLLGIVYGMVRSTSLGWGSPQVIAPIAAGVLLLAGFAAWERRVANPVVPPRLFRRRGFTLSSLVGMLVQFGMFGAIFLLTQFLQHVLGFSPLDAGLRTLPWTVMPVLVAPLAGAFGDRIGVKRLMVAATVLQASALAWFAVVVSPAVPYPALLPAMVVAGAGMGLFFAVGPRQALDFVAVEEEGVAAGVNSAGRQVGVVMGVAVLAGLFAAAGGGYGSGEEFVAGLRPALWAGAGFLALAAGAAVLTPSRPPATVHTLREAEGARRPGRPVEG